tara:strand:+ start:51 stop:443 length:393 start_codon:yes stop_codon:yes gene_type:complete
MNKLLTDKILREFGFLFGIGLPLIFGFLLPLVFAHSFREWTILVGLPFICLGIIKPHLLYYPYKIWMKLGKTLGFINSHLILGLIYFIVLIPISIIMKFFKYEPLKSVNFNLNSYRENKKEKQINLKKIF